MAQPQVNDNIDIGAPKYLDDRQGKIVAGVQLAYASFAEATSKTEGRRPVGLMVSINTTISSVQADRDYKWNGATWELYDAKVADGKATNAQSTADTAKNTADTANAKADVAQEDIERIETIDLPSKSSNNDVALKTTISAIRSLSGELKSNIFYTVDIDQEGFWIYAPDDTSTIDNTGTVLVTSDNKRLKRVIIDETVSLEMFGVKEINSSTINSQCIKKMFNSGYKRFSAKSGRIYNIDNTDLFIPNGSQINFNGSTLKCAKSTNGVVMGTEEIITFQQNGVSISVVENSRSFIYAGASSLTVGNFIWLKGQVYLTSGDNTYENGWFGRITSIEGTLVTLSHSAPRSITSDQIREYKCYENIKISNVRLDMREGTNGFGLALNYCFNSIISQSVTFSDNLNTSPIIGIYAIGINVTIQDSESNDFRFINEGAGYGFAVAGHSITLDTCIGKGSKHVIQASGRNWFSSDINYVTCKATNGRAAGIDMHANIISGSIDGCTVDTTSQAFLVRSPNISFTNNTAKLDNTSSSGVSGLVLYEGAGEGNYISNFTVKITGSSGSAKSILGYQLSLPIKALNIINCPYLMGDIEFENATTNVDSIFIENIKLIGTDSLQSRINLNSGAKFYWIKDCEFINNIPSSATFNYSINISSYTLPTRGYINKNIFRVVNVANTSSQIRINTENNEVSENTFYTNATSFINDLTATKKNTLIRNINIDNLGTNILISVASLPIPNSYFEGNIVYVLESGVRNQYVCINLSSNNFMWVRIAYTEGKNNTFTNQNTFSDITNTSDIRPRINNSFNIGAPSSAYSLAYLRRIIGGLTNEDLLISSIASNGVSFYTASTGTPRGRLDGAGIWMYTDTGILADITPPANNRAISIWNTISKGLLPPRLTLSQKNSISTPIQEGLFLYDLDNHSISHFNGLDWSLLSVVPRENPSATSAPSLATLNALPLTTHPVGITLDYTNDSVLMSYRRITSGWTQTPIQKII